MRKDQSSICLSSTRRSSFSSFGECLVLLPLAVGCCFWWHRFAVTHVACRWCVTCGAPSYALQHSCKNHVSCRRVGRGAARAQRVLQTPREAKSRRRRGGQSKVRTHPLPTFTVAETRQDETRRGVRFGVLRTHLQDTTPALRACVASLITTLREPLTCGVRLFACAGLDRSKASAARRHKHDSANGSHTDEAQHAPAAATAANGAAVAAPSGNRNRSHSTRSGRSARSAASARSGSRHQRRGRAASSSSDDSSDVSSDDEGGADSSDASSSDDGRLESKSSAAAPRSAAPLRAVVPDPPHHEGYLRKKGKSKFESAVSFSSCHR